MQMPLWEPTIGYLGRMKVPVNYSLRSYWTCPNKPPLYLWGTSTCQVLTGSTTQLAKVQRILTAPGWQFNGTASKEADLERCLPWSAAWSTVPTEWISRAKWRLVASCLGHSDHKEINFKIFIDRTKSASETSTLDMGRADFSAQGTSELGPLGKYFNHNQQENCQTQIKVNTDILFCCVYFQDLYGSIINLVWFSTENEMD